MKMHRMTAVLVVSILGIFVAAAGSFAAKGGNGGGKPGDEPPPPPLPGDLCKDEEDFPALVYVVSTIENAGHRSKERTTNDVYLADRDRSCSLLIYSGPEHLVNSLPYRPSQPSSYRQAGTRGVIVGNRPVNAKGNKCAGDEILTLTFDIEDGVVTTDLPLSVEVVYQATLCKRISTATVSGDGSKIYFSTGGTLEVIDLDSCDPECSAETIYSGPDTYVTAITLNTTDTRIYMRASSETTGERGAAFVERDSNGDWLSQIKYVVSDSDIGYESVDFTGPVWPALWAYEGNGILHEVLAVSRNIDYDTAPTYFDIFDVDDCDPSTVGTSCFADGLATRVKTMLPGVPIGFTSFATHGDGPNIFVDVNTECCATLVWELDPATETQTEVFSFGVTGFDSAD